MTDLESAVIDPATAPTESARRPKAWPVPSSNALSPVIVNVGALVVVTLILAWTYGVLGGGSPIPLSGVAYMNGYVDCLEDGLVPCTRMGFPEGTRLGLGTSLIASLFALNEIGFDPRTAFSLLIVGMLAAGSASLWWSVRLLGGGNVAGWSAAMLFYLLGPVYGHAGLPTLYFGLGAMPVALVGALGYRRAVLDGQRGGSFRWLTLILLAGFVLVFCEPYAFVIAGVALGLIAVSSAAAVARQDVRSAIRHLAAPLVYGVGLVAYQGIDSSGGGYQSPMDFYRAMSADLAVVFTPTGRTPLGDIVPFAIDGWNRQDFRGDGFQLSVYVGFVLLALTVAGLVAVYRRASGVAVALAVALAVVFVLSLGPSLKIADRAPEAVGADGTYSALDYLMPSEEATFTFPWAPIYELQPFASMRAVYRWQTGVLLLAAVLAPLGVSAIRRRSMPLAALGAVLLVLELPFGQIADLRPAAAIRGDQIDAFLADMDATFEDAVAPSERTLFLPAENDILAAWIAPRYQLYAYNLSYDKELARIRPLQPPAVTEAMARYNAGELQVADVCRLFADGHVQLLVFTHFNSRWDSYAWPQQPAREEELIERIRSTGVLTAAGFDLDQRQEALLVRNDGCSA